MAYRLVCRQDGAMINLIQSRIGRPLEQRSRLRPEQAKLVDG